MIIPSCTMATFEKLQDFVKCLTNKLNSRITNRMSKHRKKGEQHVKESEILHRYHVHGKPQKNIREFSNC